MLTAAVSTVGAGCSSPQAHIDALRRTKEALGARVQSANWDSNLVAYVSVLVFDQ